MKQNKNLLGFNPIVAVRKTYIKVHYILCMYACKKYHSEKAHCYDKL
jgi:hypothetical protein